MANALMTGGKVMTPEISSFEGACAAYRASTMEAFAISIASGASLDLVFVQDLTDRVIEAVAKVAGKRK